jgi:hypothetical protein
MRTSINHCFGGHNPPPFVLSKAFMGLDVTVLVKANYAPIIELQLAEILR